MSSKPQSIQDQFLNRIRIKKVPVRIYLMNGVKLEGLIDSFDQYAISLKSSLPQMIYKHAISTIMPTKNISNASSNEKTQEVEGKVGHDPYESWSTKEKNV